MKVSFILLVLLSFNGYADDHAWYNAAFNIWSDKTIEPIKPINTSVVPTLDITEVSVAQYKKFVDDIKYQEPQYWSNMNLTEIMHHPVVNVNLSDARKYCEWIGKRLPTSREWRSYAGTTRWAWGNKWDHTKVNSASHMFNNDDGYLYTAPVNSYVSGSTPSGILNMSGNVAEWTNNGYVMGGSYRSSRGGVSVSDRILHRHTHKDYDIGFRCISK